MVVGNSQQQIDLLSLRRGLRGEYGLYAKQRYENMMKQDNLFYEWNYKTQLLDLTWILETEDGKFYQKTKSINVDKYIKSLDLPSEKDGVVHSVKTITPDVKFSM